MQSWLIILILGIVAYFISSAIFDYMDKLKREEWNVSIFEEKLQEFNSIQYIYVNNLTILENYQNRLLNYYDDQNKLIPFDIIDLEDDINNYLLSLNESKKSMIQSQELLQNVVSSCYSLINTVYASKEKMKVNNSVSDYNPIRLIWNIYYLYTGTALEEKCKSYQEILNQLMSSIKHVLSISRDFVQQTEFNKLVLEINEIDIKQKVIYTEKFINKELVFEE